MARCFQVIDCRKWLHQEGQLSSLADGSNLLDPLVSCPLLLTVSPGTLESILLMMVQLRLRFWKLKLEAELGLLGRGEVGTLLLLYNDVIAAIVQRGKDLTISIWLEGASLAYSSSLHLNCLKTQYLRNDSRKMQAWMRSAACRRELLERQEHSSPLVVALVPLDPRLVDSFCRTHLRVLVKETNSLA